jgi:ligand-binding sensor domain-containing protein
MAQKHQGIPYVKSFDPLTYGASMQNGDIAQDDRGVLYFANNDGMLSFNGVEWQIFPLPNKTIVRSLEIDDRGIIYCGGQNAFGRFEPNTSGQWVYRSLLARIPAKYRDFEDVWDMHVQDENVYFRSSNRIYRYSDKNVAVFDTIGFQFFDMVNDRVLVQGIDGFIYGFQGERFEKLHTVQLPTGSLVTGATPSGSSIIIATLNHGLFALENGSFTALDPTLNVWLSQNEVTCIAAMENGSLVVGTGFSGMIVLDSEMRLRYHIDKSNGLQNNQVRSLIVDKDQDIWLSMNKGISFIEANSSFTYIKPDGQLDGIGYTAAVHEGKIYFGTNNGVYYADILPDRIRIDDFGKYTQVAGTQGQVWGLDVVNGQLILSHANGIFLIEEDQAYLLDSRTGAWLIREDINNEDNYFIGTYNGVYRAADLEGSLQPDRRISDMIESSRFLEQDMDGNAWVAHPYRGIYRLFLSKTRKDTWLFEYYDEERGLPSSLHNHVFSVMERILFCAEQGVYIFNAGDKRFEPYGPMNDIFGPDTKIRRLFEDSRKNIWFITDQTIGLLEIMDAGLERKISKREFPNLTKKLNAGWEFIYPYDDENVFIASTEGFIHYDPTWQVAKDTSLLIQFNEIRTTGRNDSLFFSGIHFDGRHILPRQQADQELVFPPKYNTIQFQFSAVHYSNFNDLHYRFKLDGLDREWSDWTPNHTKEYTQLRPGSYVFMVEATTSDGRLSGSATFRLEVTRPWYRSTMANILYTLLAIVSLFLFIYVNRRKVLRLEEEVEQTVTQSKSEIERLESEKIAEQLEYKKRELITSTMHLVHKNEMMREIMGKLVDIRKVCPDDATSTQLKKLIHVVERDADLDENWEDLMYHFNEVHEDFYTNLKQQFPELTNKDLKLCAYLRMNLSTKDIALLSNVSHRGIDASRYRLRKKLDLDSEVNLTEFMMQF